MKRRAKVIETVQTSQTDTITEESMIDLPVKGMSEMQGPCVVKAMAMGGASFDYQSVKFSSEVIIEDVDFSELPEAQEMAEEAVFERVHAMEERAQELLDKLLTDKNAR